MTGKLIRYIKKLPKTQRIQFIAALLLTVSLIFIIPAYAWYSSEREAAFITKVGSPIELEIKAGHQEAISNLDLSNIDVEERDSENNRILEKDYIFCVKGQNTPAVLSFSPEYFFILLLLSGRIMAFNTNTMLPKIHVSVFNKEAAEKIPKISIEMISKACAVHACRTYERIISFRENGST